MLSKRKSSTSAALRKVCIVGSGNWGSAIATIIGKTVLKNSNIFHKDVNMWVHQETIDGQLITDIINTKHENVKYLPGITLPSNIIAVPDIKDAISGCSAFVFVMPHQFVLKTAAEMKGNIPKDSIAISLIKGIHFDEAESKLNLVSQMIGKELGITVDALMGANIANEVARGDFCESTIGSHSPKVAAIWESLFSTPLFHVTSVDNIAGVELCGALKNVVAIAAGFSDGLGFGSNTKAAIMRLGLMDMRRFARQFYDVTDAETYFQSCGMADLITTCFAGRNRRVAEAFAKAGGSKTFADLEKEILNGQKLQGVLTANEVHAVTKKAGSTKAYPIFSLVYHIAAGNTGLDKFVSALGEAVSNLEKHTHKK